jgi:hypothetical protein
MASFPTQPWQRPVTTWVYKPEAGNTVYNSWWWAVCRSKHVDPSKNFGIINSITSFILLVFLLSHTTLHGSMNIKVYPVYVVPPHCHWFSFSTGRVQLTLILLMWRIVWDPNSIPIYIQQDATLHYLYLETSLHVSGGTSTHHQERIQLYLQHLVFVILLLLSAAIVEELEPVWACCGWRTVYQNYMFRSWYRSS